jgi:hypothetical protein
MVEVLDWIVTHQTEALAIGFLVTLALSEVAGAFRGR